MRSLVKVLDRLTDICGFVSGILILASMVIICYEVTVRYFFLHPTEWAIPLTGYLLCYLSLLSFAWVLKKEGHTAVDIFVQRLGSKKRAILNKSVSFACMLVSAAMLMGGSVAMWQTFSRHEWLAGGFAAPKFLLLFPIALGSFLLVIQFARRWRMPAGEFTFPES